MRPARPEAARRPTVEPAPARNPAALPNLRISRSPALPLVLGVSLIAGLLTALAGRAVAPPAVRLQVGSYDEPFVGPGWSRASRADIDPQAAGGGPTSFYHRFTPVNAGLRLPVAPRSGASELAVRATARVRSAVGVFVSGDKVADVLVEAGPWRSYGVSLPAGAIRGGELDLSLALRPLPLVPGAHVARPAIAVDYVELSAAGGLRPSWRGCVAAGAAAAAVAAFGAWLGGATAGLATGVLVSAACVALLWLAPLPFLAAVPRLLPAALLTGLATAVLLRRAAVPARDRTALAALVAGGVLLHGSVVFFPDHNPPDIDIHVRRTLDLAGVPLAYDALLRYGSHLPTASQDQGAATAALGERTLIPYPPLSYFFYYALHLAGLDLYWAMTVANVVLAMAVAPCLWLAARRIWDGRSAWVATVLYALDLAVWHHVGRSHAPAVFGAALATGALLYLAVETPRLGARRRAAVAGAFLALAVLGYSSAVVLMGLFGLALLALVLFDARALSAAARRGLAGALVVGGILAGGLFYFHYVPGLLSGAAGVEAEPDLFPGRTFLIFHNESRQSYRLWLLGFWIPLAAGLAALPFALRRAAAWARPVLVAWLLAWAGVMLLKEPFLFPRLLRWAKEDQFLSPLLCLLIGAAAGGLPRLWMRWGAATAAIATALWLQLRDFAHHADSLRL